MCGAEFGAGLHRAPHPVKVRMRRQDEGIDIENPHDMVGKCGFDRAHDFGTSDDFLLQRRSRRAHQRQSDSSEARLGGARDEVNRVDTSACQIGDRQAA
ncbi:hypothetical protein QN224_32840 [Sinorhizobium sp. 8-89]|uniref:hypothetical protein n=1 Tax=Sinorhizobium sp. 7-81 TaxID=3049087 RepID=UPI0024C293D6|nr:hypothetical protein [Sinorhizobium sp. 7-81]MDK1390095.1 hypothetical protein [Sinorhizobium sp. 7-81]